MALAGCTSTLGERSLYDERQRHEMYLDVEYFGEDWYEHSELNDHYDIVYGNGPSPNEVDTVVMARVDIYPDIETATEWMDRSRERYRGQNEFDLADEAFWATQNQNAAYSHFRHLNARGQVLAAQELSTVHGPKVRPWMEKAVEVAKAMFERWEEL